MKDLNHLPAAKRRELDQVVRLIFEEFSDATVLAQQNWKKQSRLLRIILFGSYARGDWVDEPHTTKGYQSDFDLLLVVSHPKLVDRAHYWAKAEERLIRERTITKLLRTPVNFIVHTLDDVNRALVEGRYFFADIVRDGIPLYEADDGRFELPRPKSADEALAMAIEYRDEWLPSAGVFLKAASGLIAQGHCKEAAFLLHQAAERYYHGFLLTITSYTSQTHNLKFLRSQAERFDPRLIDVWPRSAKAEKARFEKLKEAYVRARYSRHFDISQDDLVWIEGRLNILGYLIKSFCDLHIEGLRSNI